jgi:hypothetical protein
MLGSEREQSSAPSFIGRLNINHDGIVLVVRYGETVAEQKLCVAEVTAVHMENLLASAASCCRSEFNVA